MICVLSTDEVISGVMSAIHSLPGTPSYAAMYTSSHTHLTKPRPQHQEVRRSARGTVQTFRLPRQANSNSDFEPSCASVSWCWQWIIVAFPPSCIGRAGLVLVDLLHGGTARCPYVDLDIGKNTSTSPLVRDLTFQLPPDT